MVRFITDQSDDRNNSDIDKMKSLDTNKNIINQNNEANSDAGQCIALANETLSSNEDEDVYLNVNFCKTNNITTNPLFENNHKTFVKNHKHDVPKGNGQIESQGDSCDEIYENYTTPTSTKVEINRCNDEQSRTFTKHAFINTMVDKVSNEVTKLEVKDISSSSSEVDTSTSDKANDVTNYSEESLVKEDENVDNLYENIETIREAMTKNKTFKIKNGKANHVNGHGKHFENIRNDNGHHLNRNNSHFHEIKNGHVNHLNGSGNHFAGENLVVINERLAKNKDSLDRNETRQDAVAGGSASVDKVEGKVKSSRSKGGR